MLDEIEQFSRKNKKRCYEVVKIYSMNIQQVAMSPMQVSVERLFSALKLYKSHLWHKSIYEGGSGKYHTIILNNKLFNNNNEYVFFKCTHVKGEF